MLKLALERSLFEQGVRFYLYEKHDNLISIGEPVLMKTEEVPGPSSPYPTFALPDTAAQQLMDELWNIGFRPSEGTGSAGALAATQKHLKDMRKIAFDVLDNMVTGK
jgi:hypothetical protein